MKNKKVLFISLLSLFLPLSSCKNNPENLKKTYKIHLEDFVKVLENSLYEKEVLGSKTSKHISILENNNRKETIIENGTFFNDEVTYYNGNKEIKYFNNDETTTETYLKVAETRKHPLINTNGLQTIFYLVTDYQKEETESTKDKAYRIPVYENIDPSKGEEGIDYLLAKDVKGQLSKQVSLLVDTFIASNLTGNINVSTSGASFKDSITVNETKDGSSYEFEEFGYSYHDDDSEINTHISVDFSINLDNNGNLIKAETKLVTTESRNEEVYTTTLLDTYELTYGNRASSIEFNGQKIDGTDYFLREINSINALKNNNGDFIELDLNKLPIKEYIHFEANEYIPSKAIDTKLKVVEIKNDTTNSFIIDNGLLYANNVGECDVVLASESGISFTSHVKSISPSLESINFYDTYAGFERLEDGTRKAYSNNTYEKINISVKPSGCDLNDIKFEISDPSLLSIEEYSRGEGLISYRYKFHSVTENKNVTVTFYSESNPNIKISINYFIELVYTPSEIKEFIINKTYSWKHIYSNSTFHLIFDSSTNGRYIKSIPNDPSTYGKVVNFTYNIKDDYKFLMTPIDGEFDFTFLFEESYIAKDGKTIFLEDDTYRTQNYVLAE